MAVYFQLECIAPHLAVAVAAAVAVVAVAAAAVPVVAVAAADRSFLRFVGIDCSSHQYFCRPLRTLHFLRLEESLETVLGTVGSHRDRLP